MNNPYPAGHPNGCLCTTCIAVRTAWGHPAPVTKQKHYGWRAAAVVVPICFLAGVISIAASANGGSGAKRISKSLGLTPHTVTYKVEGTATQASITYENSTGDSSQQSDIDVPMVRKSDGGEGIVLENMHRGDFLYISAQNSNEYGSVTCIIEVDGVVVKTNTSHGGFTIATCSGRL